MEKTKIYAYHLDYLRRKYNMTEEVFCDGICSDRSFRRFVDGSRKLSIEMVFMFCEKLGISVEDFFYNFQIREREELIKIKKLHEYIRNREFDLFYRDFKKVRYERLLNNQNKRLFNYCVVKADLHTNKIHQSHAIDKLSELCDYPKCLTREIFDFVDICALHSISEIESLKGVYKTLNKLLEILQNLDMIYLSSDSKDIYPTIYTNVSIDLFDSHRYNESLDISTRGIEYCRMYNDLYTLPHLRYIRAISLLKLGYRKDAEIEAIRCYSLAMGKGDPSEVTMFNNALFEKFGFYPSDLIKVYEKELQIKQDN